MSKKPDLVKVPSVKKEQETDYCPIMKALDQSMAINNFSTNCQFTKDLGLELLKGSATPEHIEVLKVSISGVLSFIFLLKEKMEEFKSK